jgi:hypothetical protein
MVKKKKLLKDKALKEHDPITELPRSNSSIFFFFFPYLTILLAAETPREKET